jgi:DDE superfamily endonuclease/Arm domain-containing DNA-binding protein
MDETAVSVRGGRYYLYRAVDRYGKSVDSLLCRDRTVESARAFFRKAVASESGSWPIKINLDGNAASHCALRNLRYDDARWCTVLVRARRYLNNVVEQDHRAIKQRCASMLGFKSSRTAAITLAGVELAHRIRKGQFSVMGSGPGRRASLRQLWDQALYGRAVHGEQVNGFLPSMHQISHRRQIARRKVARQEFVRYPRKHSHGRGLYLLVMPKGGRHWRYKYRYNGKHKTLALGVFPDVPVDRARARLQAARQLLAAGIDPAHRKEELRRVAPTFHSTP